MSVKCVFSPIALSILVNFKIYLESKTTACINICIKTKHLDHCTSSPKPEAEHKWAKKIFIYLQKCQLQKSQVPSELAKFELILYVPKK